MQVLLFTVTFLLGILTLTSAVSLTYPNYQVLELGGDVTLPCNDTFLPDGSVPLFWVSPQRMAMGLNMSEGNRRVSSEGDELHITRVTREDLGYWYCGLRTPNETTYMQRIGLNANGPYFQDLWEKYRQNTIIGVSAGAGFAVIAVVLCLVYQFRWEKRMGLRSVQDDINSDYINDIKSSSPVIELGPMPSKVSLNGGQPSVEPQAFDDVKEEQGQTNGAAIGQTNEAFVAEAPEAPPAYNGTSQQTADTRTDAVVHF